MFVICFALVLFLVLQTFQTTTIDDGLCITCLCTNYLCIKLVAMSLYLQVLQGQRETKGTLDHLGIREFLDFPAWEVNMWFAVANYLNCVPLLLQKRRFGILYYTYSLFSCLLNSENWFSKNVAARGASLSFLYTGGCQFEWHYWGTCGCTLASVIVSAFAITCAALSVENECRINPLKKTKDPWHWTSLQRACVHARWDRSSIFVWQVKPLKHHREPSNVVSKDVKKKAKCTKTLPRRV